MRSHFSHFIHWVIVLALTVPSLPTSAKTTDHSLSTHIAEIEQPPVSRSPLQAEPASEDTPMRSEQAYSAITDALPSAAEVVSPTISLKADPDYLLPGKGISLLWELSNWTEGLEGLFLAWELAPGFIPVEVKDGFDPVTGKLVVPLPDLSGSLRHRKPMATTPPPATWPTRAAPVLRNCIWRPPARRHGV